VQKAMLTDLIKQIFHHYNVGNLIVTDRILNQFKIELNRMEKAKGKAKCGGRQIKLLMDKWSDGKYSLWKLKICYSEVDNVVTKAENSKLKSEKRKLEDQLEQVSVKVAKLESKVDKSSNSE
jgi:hypothetical protein